MSALILLGVVLTGVAAWLTIWFTARTVLTLRARAWAPTMARRLSRLVRTHDYVGDRFFAADSADRAVCEARRAALDRLGAVTRAHRDQSLAWNAQVRASFSDLRFTDANRVPFPFAREMRERFDLSTVVTASDGPRLRDLDGTRAAAVESVLRGGDASQTRRPPCVAQR
jgi:glutamate-1-semialdehyde 2,1-aminomutase